MKKMFISAMLASSLVSPAVADDFGELLLCSMKAEAANAFMRARQVGVSMDTMREGVASQMSGGFAADAAYVDEMILDAYSQKKEHTEEGQQRAIDAFESATYLQCTRELRAKAE